MNCTMPKKKQNQKFGDDNDSLNSSEDIRDALILSVNSLVDIGGCQIYSWDQEKSDLYWLVG